MHIRLILDSALNSLIRKERMGECLPLALRRFADGVREQSASDAMRVAVSGLLRMYGHSQVTLRAPVRVERLCELVGAKVTVPPRLAPSKSQHPIGTTRPRRSHTGAIVFTSSGPHISVPATVDRATGRISVAHELGHLLIHRRGDKWDEATVRLPVTIDEEALAEYAARLFLMPASLWEEMVKNCSNLAEIVLGAASAAGVTVHAAVTRLGDPDVTTLGVRGAILWRLNRNADPRAAIPQRLTPYWHLCPDAFIPIGKCKARTGSLTADLAGTPGPVSGSKMEDVEIGSFVGTFLVDGHAWGSVDDGTRLVLTIYRLDDATGSRPVSFDHSMHRTH